MAFLASQAIHLSSAQGIVISTILILDSKGKFVSGYWLQLGYVYLSAFEVEGLRPSPSPLFPFMVASPSGDASGMNFHLVTVPRPLSHGCRPLFFLFPQPSNVPPSPLLFIPTALERPPIPPSFYSHSPRTSPRPPLLFIPTALECPPPLMHPSSAFPGPITKIPPFPLPCFLVPSPTFPGPLSPLSPLFSSNRPFLSLHPPFPVLCAAVICAMYGSSVS
ncbi:hypothetical protein BD769DRAFT_1665633 [Suillus cothurnatus]|nr:hypothetical protein BD769DRAFT_1665633 [Suillus cothurnatus]